MEREYKVESSGGDLRVVAPLFGYSCFSNVCEACSHRVRSPPAIYPAITNCPGPDVLERIGVREVSVGSVIKINRERSHAVHDQQKDPTLVTVLPDRRLDPIRKRPAVPAVFFDAFVSRDAFQGFLR